MLFPIGRTPVSAQSSILTGQVTNAETGNPVSNANVFLDGTMQGDATNEQGRFRLENVSPGTYLLVISRIDYTIRRGQISVSAGETRRFRIELHPDPIEMKGVTVEENRSAWLDRLDRFRKYFLGEVPNAERTEILNPEVLSFESENDTLRARAVKPLRVENRALGYEIVYHLRSFEAYDNRVRQDIFARFREMEPTDQRQRRAWEEARAKAYWGSFQHFVRTLAKDTFEDEGFRVYTSIRRQYYYGNDPQERLDGLEPIHEAREIASPASQPTVLKLRFPTDFLRVEYFRDPEPRSYRQEKLSRRVRRTGNRQLSWLELTRDSALVDIQSGWSLPSFAPVLHGYWGWAEREPNALPRTYAPDDRGSDPKE